MAINTISRGSFSKGKQVAEAAACKLDYQCVSRGHCAGGIQKVQYSGNQIDARNSRCTFDCNNDAIGSREFG
jgi:hypothetical protein